MPQAQVIRRQIRQLFKTQKPKQSKAMNKELLAMYRKCRASGMGMIVGEDAIRSLHSARAILAFRKAESNGLVRLRAEEEQENYFDVYGREMSDAEQKRMKKIIERDGCWWTCSEWFDGQQWQQADSCGMHTGYSDVLSPFDNCYIVGLVGSALDYLSTHSEALCCP